MASTNEESSGSSTESIDYSVRSNYEFRSMATQSHEDSETFFISTDFSSSGNSEITNSNDPLVDTLGGNVSPLMFQSQSTNLDSQAQDPNICRQIFPTESFTQNYSDTSSQTIHVPNTTDASTSGILNPEPSTSGIIHQFSSDGTETTKSEHSDSISNTESLSTTVSESPGCTINTESLSQYTRGVETQDESQEMYPSTMSQSSEGLQRSDRRTVQRYDIASNSSSSSMDLMYDPSVETPPLRRQYAICIPSTSRKRDLESTDEENEDNIFIPHKKIQEKGLNYS